MHLVETLSVRRFRTLLILIVTAVFYARVIRSEVFRFYGRFSVLAGFLQLEKMNCLYR